MILDENLPSTKTVNAHFLQLKARGFCALLPNSVTSMHILKRNSV